MLSYFLKVLVVSRTPFGASTLLYLLYYCWKYKYITCGINVCDEMTVDQDATIIFYATLITSGAMTANSHRH